MPQGASPPPKLRVIFSEAEVRASIDALVGRLESRFAGCALLLVVIAEGARRFGRELARGLEARGSTPEVLEVRARRTSGTELREVEVESVDPGAFVGRDVVVVDDIADEGRTLEAVSKLVRRGEPRSLSIAVLVSKPAHRSVELSLDYVGFQVPDAWIVGYGMDLDGAYRDLDYLAIIEPH